ncbi:ATP-binding protein [Candidatus Woesearchaeota archaeon]|nr:ATP-binding protein [Candidatus Woesearchaeota archaeon]
MEAQQQIERFKEIIEKSYLAVLNNNLRKDKKFLVIDFSELSKFDPELADMLLEQPEDTIKAAELAVEQLDIENSENTKIRFSNLPESQSMMVRNIRSKHLNKLFQIEGIVRQKSDVRPQVTAAKFECPSCGNVINVLQLDSSFKEPSRCGCGRKGKFRLVSKELVDAQRIMLEESPEKLEGGEQPKRMNVFLKDDLVSPISEKKTSPGAKVRIVGLVKEIPIILRTGAKSTTFDLLIEANYIEAAEETFSEIEITKEEELQFRELAEDPHFYKKLSGSIAPSIYGHDRIKEAILLQMVGGIHKVRKDGVVSRGDMHILLIGDPGAGKCCGSETKIILESGEITSISSFYENALHHKNTLNCKGGIFSIDEKGLNFTSQPIRFWKRKAPSSMIRIVTCSGNEITITKGHPLFTTKDGLIFSKRAEEYKEGSYIAAPSKLDIEGSLQSLPVKQQKTKKHDDKEAAYRCILDERHALRLGRLIAGKNKRKGSESIILPPIICRSPDCILKEFISSLFGLSAKIKKEKEEIEFCSKSKELVYGLKYALLRFGIISKIGPSSGPGSDKNKIKLPIFSLKVSKGCLIRYHKKIGFVSDEKNKQLKSLIEKKDFLCDKMDVIPGLKGILRILRKKYCIPYPSFGIPPAEYKSYEKGDKLPSHQSLRKICRAYLKTDGSKNDPLIGILSQASKSEIFWDRIKRVEEVKDYEGYVYDLEIERVHNFVANGLVAHNSALLKRSNIIAPKSRYISGKGVSGAGLTAAVVKDEFLKGWSLEAGAMVLASNGMCCIDEMDKISPEDRSAMHEAMENQTVSISKANIQATLIARTTVLAAANPKFGRFDPYGIVAEQIDLPPALINRFDLIFVIKDLPDEKKDGLLASHILNLHQSPKMQEPELDTEMLKKYIGYAKKNITPKLTDGAIEEIKKYYLKMRASGSGEDGVKTIPISARQLEGLVRLSESNARLRLSEEVARKDAKRAIDLLEFSLMQVGFDKETGKIDIDRIATGVSASARNNIHVVKEIIAEMESRVGKTIPIDDVVSAAKEKGIKEDKVEEVIQKLKIKGDLYEPRSGFVSRI